MPIPRFLATSAAAALLLQSFSFINAPSQVSSLQSITLGFAAPASSTQTIYKPPLRPRPVVRTSGTGSRGCNQKNQPIQLNLLVPERHVGQTVSARPSFLWYLENAKVAKFTLVEPGVPKPLLEKTIQASEAGIMRVELPQSSPELAVGKEYRWSVTVLCNPNRPSEVASYTQSFIERVAPTVELSKQLGGTKSVLERARIYAQAGLWYDAVSSLSEVSDKDKAARNELLSLLDQVGLTNVTKQARKGEQASNLH